MAEAIGRRYIAARLGMQEAALTAAGVRVASGGLTDDYEPPESPPSAHGVTAMLSHEYDTSAHRSTVLSSDQLQAAARIYCVSDSHRNWILREHPGVEPGRVTTLGADVPDPWHGPLREYERTADTLLRFVPQKLEADWSALQASLSLGGGD